MSIEIKSLNGYTDGDGDAKVVGFIENTDKRPLKNVTVEVTMFDGDSLVAVAEDWIDRIPPGGKRAFEVNEWDTWMTRFEVQVYGE
tara:strand:- start:292 stop:549 length:258 start_codon:yes stop_codon:yes gene_type:complete